jgi:hypothetical protein
MAHKTVEFMKESFNFYLLNLQRPVLPTPAPYILLLSYTGAQQKHIQPSVSVNARENYSAFKCQDNPVYTSTNNYVKDRDEASLLPRLPGTFQAMEDSPCYSQVKSREEEVLGLTDS